MHIGLYFGTPLCNMLSQLAVVEVVVQVEVGQGWVVDLVETTFQLH
jgi:hypothetical protein